MHTATILVIDDDPSINRFLQDTLEGEGWKTHSVFNGEEAIKLIRESLPDLVILDIGLPGIDGFEVCRHITGTSSVPVVMLSARGDMNDKVRCLDMGAEDFITKPFQPRELIARVKGILRRHNRERPVPSPSPLLTGNLEIDFEARRVRVKGKDAKLTRTEYCLLEELVLNAGKTLPHGKLLTNIWGPEYASDKDYLQVHISHLRSKIEPDSENPVYIVTVPGIGYRFETVPSKPSGTSNGLR